MMVLSLACCASVRVETVKMTLNSAAAVEP